MDTLPIGNINSKSQDDTPKRLQRVDIHFDLDAIAHALAISPLELQQRMLQVVLGAICVDAAQMASEEMRMAGRRLGADGWPDGWPLAHIVAVARHRLYGSNEAPGGTQ